MRQEIADLVHPIFAAGLELRERLERGETPLLEAEQARLIGMLLADAEARRLPEYGGDIPDDRTLLLERSGELGMRSLSDGPSRYLGIRYALVCWLDELFILDSSWAEKWNEYKLEVRLYGGNDRAWRFWEQARLAANRSGQDSLIAFFLCVMLGFSGELLEDPAQLAGWVAATRAQLARGADRGWRPPPELDPGTHVPPLRGRESLQRMILIGGLIMLTLVPLVAWLIARQLG